ncbi:MAG: thioredoxin family protein [Mariniblastus sp.]
MGPVIDELATDNDGKAIVGKVNVGDHMELAVKYGISAVPTLLVFKGGEVVERMQGFKDKAELQSVIDTHSTSA